jgi:hypothetical protein
VSREKFVVVVVFGGGGAGGDGTFSHPRAGGRALSPIDPCQGRFKAERWPILQLLRGRFFTLLSLLLGRPCPAADRQWTFHAIAPRSLSPLLRRVHRGLGVTVRKKTRGATCRGRYLSTGGVQLGRPWQGRRREVFSGRTRRKPGRTSGATWIGTNRSGCRSKIKREDATRKTSRK